MFKKCFIITFFVLFCIVGKANTDTLTKHNTRLRISLLTCGVGEEAWETFGHTALRVIDSDKTGAEKDVVFNYGMFNGFDKDFEINFMRGKLLYFIAIETFEDFTEEYIRFKRVVYEQELFMSTYQKEQLLFALEENTLPENRYYKYDFFFDNCATRIRDIIPNTIKNGFVYGNALPQNSHLSFRDIINIYFYRKHWTRIGVNILLGSKIDKVMTNSEIMFLPDFLSTGLAKATVNNAKICSEPVILIKGAPEPTKGTNQPLVVTISLAILTIFGISFKKLQLLGRIMSFILLISTGLLGCLILVMWFGTNHQTCADNFNLLWLLPTNIILAFAKPKGRGRYALVAICLIFVTLILHIAKIQQVTITELSPLFLAMLFVYAGIFRRSIKLKDNANNKY